MTDVQQIKEAGDAVRDALSTLKTLINNTSIMYWTRIIDRNIDNVTKNWKVDALTRCITVEILFLT